MVKMINFVIYVLSQNKKQSLNLSSQTLTEQTGQPDFTSLFHPPTLPLAEGAFHVPSVLPKLWVEPLAATAASAF